MINRRNFIKSSALAGAGLTLGYSLMAQGKAAGVEAGVDALGKCQQRGVLRRVGGMKDQRVVLVGGERLFHAAFGTQRQPAPA